MPLSHASVVKRGTFLYAGAVVCEIRIFKTDLRPGTGGFQDPPEWRDDQEGEYYTIQYGSTTASGEFNAGGGWFASLEEAMHHAREAVGTNGGLNWYD